MTGKSSEASALLQDAFSRRAFGYFSETALETDRIFTAISQDLAKTCNVTSVLLKQDMKSLKDDVLARSLLKSQLQRRMLPQIRCAIETVASGLVPDTDSLCESGRQLIEIRTVLENVRQAAERIQEEADSIARDEQVKAEILETCSNVLREAQESKRQNLDKLANCRREKQELQSLIAWIETEVQTLKDERSNCHADLKEKVCCFERDVALEEQQNDRLRDKIGEVQARIEGAESAKQRLAQEIRESEASLHECNEHISGVVEVAIERLKKRIESLNFEAESFKQSQAMAEVSAKNAEIAMLEDRVSQKMVAIETLTELDCQIRNNNASLDDKAAKVAEVQEEIEKVKNDINRVKTKLERLPKCQPVAVAESLQANRQIVQENAELEAQLQAKTEMRVATGKRAYEYRDEYGKAQRMKTQCDQELFELRVRNGKEILALKQQICRLNSIMEDTRGGDSDSDDNVNSGKRHCVVDGAILVE